jgi:hypothetical protein
VLTFSGLGAQAGADAIGSCAAAMLLAGVKWGLEIAYVYALVLVLGSPEGRRGFQEGVS